MPNFQLVTPSGLLVGSHAAGGMSNSSAETSLISQTVPGGLMNLYNRLRFTIICSISTQLLTPGSLTIRVKYGSAVLTLPSGAITLLANQANQPFNISGRVRNKGATNAQILFAEIRQGGSALTLGTPNAQGILTPAIDSTADQAFAVTAQFSLASATNVLAVQDVDLEIS
ncbi:MAG: hypothetical protein U0800_27670 [Isosphaeraceae bacterium]